MSDSNPATNPDVYPEYSSWKNAQDDYATVNVTIDDYVNATENDDEYDAVQLVPTVEPTFQLSPSYYPTNQPTLYLNSTNSIVVVENNVFLIGSAVIGILLLSLAVLYYMREFLLCLLGAERIDDNYYFERKTVGVPVDIEGGESSVSDISPLLRRPPPASAMVTVNRSSTVNNNSNNRSALNIIPIKNAMKFSVDDVNTSLTTDREMFTKFSAIMGAGIIVSLHTTKGPRPIKFSIQEVEVRWETAVRRDPPPGAPVGTVVPPTKRYKLRLVDIVHVEVGKETSNFRKQRESNKGVSDDLCFSLVTEKTTLDLEATSKLDRDAIVRGFRLAIERAKSRLLSR